MNFETVYILISKITYLSLHNLPFFFNLKNGKYVLKINMKNYDSLYQKLQIHDPIEIYFECISFCDVKDGACISKRVEILKKYDK